MAVCEKHNRISHCIRFLTGISLIFGCTSIFGQSTTVEQTEQRLLNEAKLNIEKYRKGDMEVSFIDKKGKPLRNMQVEINQLTQDFLFGNLSEERFNPNLTADEVGKFEKYFTDLFNFTELTVKWSYYEGKQGKPQWAALQQKLDWCYKNNIVPKGHTLGWTNMSGTPAWLLKQPLETTYELYKARIYNLVGGFKDQVAMWDVINEPITTIPWEAAMKDSVFGKSLIDAGTRYDTKNVTLEDVVPWVEHSLRWAYEANPKANLMLNEFYIIAKPEIREKFYQLIKELQRRRVPLTGIGIQAHEPREMWFSPLEIIATYDKYQELGIPLHITEFIPQSSMKKITGGWRQGVWTEEAQAEFAEQFYTLSFGHPAIASIHWWGLTDKMIWLEGGGLLDKNMTPKPVYHRLHKLIKEEWMTRNVHQKTTSKGKIKFRGFYGQYEAVVRLENGTKQFFHFHLEENGANNLIFTLD